MAHFILFDRIIKAALTGVVTEPVSIGKTPPDASQYLGLQANFTYSGSGGTSCKAWIQTSFDEGTTWIDVANFAFATTTARKISAVKTAIALAAAATPTDGTLADNTILDGCLGDRVRAKITTTGTYASVAASQTITYVGATNPTAGKTVTIDGLAYKFVATVADPGDVKIGAAADNTWTSFSQCINKSGGTEGAGQDYLTIGGVAHPTVSSSINTTSDQVTLTARTAGAAGNLIFLSTTETTATLGGNLLAGGADTVLRISGVSR